jgi:tetratricopeptide (TPR) repeat protein
MKSKKREILSRSASGPAKPAGPPRSPRWPYAAAGAGAILAAFWAYSPALHGPFLFDDNFLPFAIGNVASAPLSAWIHGLRPLLMATYWMNARLSGDDPWSYHVFNIVIHLIATGLIFLIVRRLLEWARVPVGRLNLLAGFGAALFLLHPVQSEAVAYLAGRSEALSVTLVLAAFTVFLYRSSSAISWGAVMAVIALFGGAILAKEHTVVLPVLLLLTDYWWNPGFSFQGIRRNWKLYVPIAALAAGGFALALPLILGATTAGFSLKDFTWYQYFLTECRALFVYIGEFLFPISLTADWDFPISRTVLDRGAIVGLIALVALAALAWTYRRRFPLATYGYFVFLALMAPTSSILPIQDPIAERRLYFGFIGLLLILLDVLSRLTIQTRPLVAALIVAILAAAGATYARAEVWGDAVALWQDNVRKSPGKSRDHFNLAFAYYAEGRPDLALPEFEKTAQLQPLSQSLLVDWGLAYDGLNRPEEALAKFQQAALLPPVPGVSPANVYTQIAKIHAQQSHWPEALDALAAAEKLDPGYPEIFSYRGKIYFKNGQLRAAIQQYQRALQLDPTLEDARHDLALAGRGLAGR